MTKRGHVPIRTCGGCGRRAPKLNLIRLVMINGEVVEDSDQHVAGRGVYSCKNELCRTRLEKNKKALRRAFRLQAG